MSAKNDCLLQIEEIVRIYANSKYLDRNVRWVLFILAEYSILYTDVHKEKGTHGWKHRRTNGLQAHRQTD